MSTTRQVSLHGRRLFLTRQDQLVSKGGFVAGQEDGPSIVYPAPDRVALFDDFLTDFTGPGTAVDTGAAGLYFLTTCADTGVTGAIVGSRANGVFRITSSPTITTATPNNSSKNIVGKGMWWKANQGGASTSNLRMAARIKTTAFPTKTSGDWSGMFIGFTDTVDHEVPMYDTGRTGDSGASAVSPASDAVGFLWGTGGDTGWRGVSANSGGGGGANDSGDQQVTLTTVRPTANKWINLELEIGSNPGDTGSMVAKFYIDGLYKGQIVSPVKPSKPLTPVVSYFDTGGANTFDIDWVNVSAARDTGE